MGKPFDSMHSTVRASHGGAMMPDTGDTAFVIMSGVLVLMMTLPGLMLFYAGLSGFKSVLSTGVQTMAIASLISICWLMFGYSLAFGPGKGNLFIGGSEKFWFMGSGEDADAVTSASLVGTIPETVFIMFQLTFAIITAAITAGSYSERMKLSSMLIFFVFWHFLVYCPVAHWVWGGGFLQKWGVLDFAGGNVVHIVSGVSGVVGSMILGPRDQDFTSRSEHTELLTFIGGSLLWVGWFGSRRGKFCGHGHARDPHLRVDLRLHLDDNRVGEDGQAHCHWRRVGRHHRPRDHHPSRRLRGPNGRFLHGARRWGHLLRLDRGQERSRHGREAQREPVPRRLRRARRCRGSRGLPDRPVRQPGCGRRRWCVLPERRAARVADPRHADYHRLDRCRDFHHPARPQVQHRYQRRAGAPEEDASLRGAPAAACYADDAHGPHDDGSAAESFPARLPSWLYHGQCLSNIHPRSPRSQPRDATRARSPPCVNVLLKM